MIPLVSIVIPAYNAGRTLAQTLDSALAQTYTNIEIIVVDDGSTDTTAEVLDAYARHVRKIHQPNAGLPFARNTGCMSAHGEFIALLDADDLCIPERIAIQVGALLNRSDSVLCSSDFSAFNREGRVADSYASAYYSVIGGAKRGLGSLYPDRAEIVLDAAVQPLLSGLSRVDAYTGNIYRALMRGNFVHPPTVMFRRGALESAGLFDEQLRYTCDWEWMVRLARTGTFIHIDRPLLDYRLSETQMSSRANNGGKSAVDVVRAATKMWNADPALIAADRHLMRKDLGEFTLDAADALLEKNKMDAAKMLFRSVWTYGIIKPETARTALKILMPMKLLQLIRNIRHSENSGTLNH